EAMPKALPPGIVLPRGLELGHIDFLSSRRCRDRPEVVEVAAILEVRPVIEGKLQRELDQFAAGNPLDYIGDVVAGERTVVSEPKIRKYLGGIFRETAPWCPIPG